MSAPQTTVNLYTALGVPGDVDYTGPQPRVTPAIVYSATHQSKFGFAYTKSSEPDFQLSATVQPGGTGVFQGILVQGKASSNFGGSHPLDPSLVLPNRATGSFLTFGTVVVNFPAAVHEGDLVEYIVEDAPVSVTATQSTTTLTVASVVSGTIYVGTVFKNASGAVIGTVVAFGTGTGGTGTYTLNASGTIASAAPLTGVYSSGEPGAIAKTYARTATFTAAQSTTTLTVSAITAGSIGVGSVIRNASGVIIGTVIEVLTITAAGGTYKLNTSATVSSAAMTANSTPAQPALSTLIPNAYVDKISLSAAGVGYITLTN
jgi:hypothetical protein